MLPPGKLATGARSELEPFLKEQPENDGLMGDLALTNRVAAFAVRPARPTAVAVFLNCGWRLWVISGL
ncbi:MAG: hypothetical protein DME32_18390 [Verrucomicrobia bacterium]|nr:MAG: hypothetical protein DME32_18390 [Verrucomicrobiota bacterium]